MKHDFEDEALEIVKAIKRDYAADLDSNDGGEILGWILKLCDQVAARVAAQKDQAIKCDASFASEVIIAFLKMGVCPSGYDRDDLREFAARLEVISKLGAVASPVPEAQPKELDKNFFNDLLNRPDGVELLARAYQEAAKRGATPVRAEQEPS